MHRFDFERWLDDWGRAWEGRDPNAFLLLLAPDVTWMRDPFADPLHGPTAVYDSLRSGLARTREIAFSWEVLTFADPRGVAHWDVTITPQSGPPVVSDGILVADFDALGHCQLLREWWNRPS